MVAIVEKRYAGSGYKRAKTTISVFVILLTPCISTVAEAFLPKCAGLYQTTDWNNCLGIYVFPDGTVYIGEFKKNKFHGRGVIISRRRGTCVGNFKYGELRGPCAAPARPLLNKKPVM